MFLDSARSNRSNSRTHYLEERVVPNGRNFCAIQTGHNFFPLFSMNSQNAHSNSVGQQHEWNLQALWNIDYFSGLQLLVFCINVSTAARHVQYLPTSNVLLVWVQAVKPGGYLFFRTLFLYFVLCACEFALFVHFKWCTEGDSPKVGTSIEECVGQRIHECVCFKVKREYVVQLKGMCFISATCLQQSLRIVQHILLTLKRHSLIDALTLSVSS